MKASKSGKTPIGPLTFHEIFFLVRAMLQSQCENTSIGPANRVVLMIIERKCSRRLSPWKKA